ncbi:MAG: ABC transporter permease [Candidatus Pacearchaeota archaeon]|jgi:putative ABC transport system permease protein
MIGDYFSLAFGNLKHRGLRSWLTMLGIFIGIAAVVSLISLGAGLQNAVTGQFSTLSTDKLVVQSAGTGFGPPGSTAVNKLTSHDIKLIETVPGVSEVIGRLVRIAKVEYNNVLDFSYLGSIPEEQKQADIVYEALNVKPKEGKILKSNDYGKVVLGSDVASSDNFGKLLRVGSKIKIQGKEFTVIGILEKSSSFQANLVILMTDKDMKSILNIGDEVDMIVVQIADKNQAEEIAVKITEKMRKDRNEKVGEEDFSVQTPLQAISSVNTILNIINLIVTSIAMISLFVGGIGITNTMYTSVLERTKEIGVMKAIGAQNKDILLIFLIEAGLLGLVGGIIGAIIGLGFAFAVSSVAAAALGENILNVQISWPLLIGAVSFSLIVGVIAGVLPAIQASKLKPTEALRR